MTFLHDMRERMPWVGKWKNQFGSLVEITNESNGRIEDTFVPPFETAAFMARPYRSWAFIRETASLSRRWAGRPQETG